MSKKRLLFFLVLASLAASPVFTEPQTATGPEKPFYLEGILESPRIQPSFHPALDCTSNYMLGDLNENTFLDFQDVVLLINCVFINPNAPSCLVCIADLNCNKILTPSDVVLLIRFAIDPPIFEIRCP